MSSSYIKEKCVRLFVRHSVSIFVCLVVCVFSYMLFISLSWTACPCSPESFIHFFCKEKWLKSSQEFTSVYVGDLLVISSLNTIEYAPMFYLLVILFMLNTDPENKRNASCNRIKIKKSKD